MAKNKVHYVEVLSLHAVKVSGIRSVLQPAMRQCRRGMRVSPRVIHNTDIKQEQDVFTEIALKHKCKFTPKCVRRAVSA